MTFTKRSLLCAVAGVLAMCGAASAQTWPTKPITFVVPFPAGGGTDAFARPLPRNSRRS